MGRGSKLVFTREIAEFSSSINYDDLSNEVIEKAKIVISDTYGVIYTGYKQPVSEILLEWIEENGGKGQSTITGYDIKTNPSFAALINGTMAHSIDYDDVNSQLNGHASAVVLPAVLAVAEAEQKTGKEILTAFITGVEVCCKLGSYMNPSHYRIGWHSTATIGVLGAAVAIGKLYEFDTEKMRTVLGLAGSMMSGLRANFGTMTKPFHVGYAARNGVEAAQFVKNGLTASKEIFTQHNNIFSIYSTEEVSESIGIDLGKPWSLVNPGFNLKRYPCCYETHRIADAAEKIILNRDIDISDIKKIECYVPKGGLAPLIYNRPQNGLEGRFSMEYVVSAMLIDKKINLNTFTDEMVRRNEVQELITKVEAIEDKQIYINRNTGELGYVLLKIYFGDKVVQEKVLHAKGSSMIPLDDSEHKRKFMNSLTNAGVQKRKANELYNRLMNIERYRSFNGSE